LQRPEENVAALHMPLRRTTGAVMLGLFALIFAFLPALAHESGTWRLIEAFFRAGSLVFGGGHVVLPLLQASFVPQTIDAARFLAGYGAAQAVPGPLFTFSAYLGASVSIGPGGWLGALIAVCAIFAPSFFLLFGIAPFWRDVRADRRVAAAVRGLGAAVVGLLLAAFVTPIWTSAITNFIDLAIAALAFALLRLQKIPPWGAVALAGVLGGAEAMLR
jgi:chromate transporter